MKLSILLSIVCNNILQKKKIVQNNLYGTLCRWNITNNFFPNKFCNIQFTNILFKLNINVKQVKIKSTNFSS